MKTVLWMIAILGILFGIIFYQHKRLEKFRNENKSLNTNINALLEGMRVYKIRDSLNAASTGAWEMKLSEYKKWRREDARLIEELNIQLKRAKTVSLHATEIHYQIVAPYRDTVVIESGRADTIPRFIYRTPYINLKGGWQRDSVRIELTAYDTLTQIVHRIPRKFLFFRYGTKSLRQEVVSKNPHTKITYTEYIELKR